MNKYTLLIAILALISFANSNTIESQSQICGRTQITCQVGYTCCRNRQTVSGWKCFPGIDSVCCSDGIHACPKGTKCNIPRNTCDPLMLTFLEIDSN